MSQNTILTADEVAAFAESFGCVAVFGDKQLLTVDIDDGDKLNEKNLEILRRAYDIEIVDSWKSRNGSGMHYLLKVNLALSHTERILFQAVLGSDPIREALAFLYGPERPIFLLRPKEAA